MYNWGSTRQFSGIFKFRPSTLKLGIHEFFNENRRVDPQLYIIWFFITKFVFLTLKTLVYAISRSMVEIYIFLKIGMWTLSYTSWDVFYHFFRVPDIKNPQITNFKFNRQSWFFFWKSTSRPSILHRRNFLLSNSCSASKPLRTNF